MLGPVLMTWTVAVVLLRLMPPRPPMRRLFLQPGAAACGAVAIGFAVECVSYLALSFARMRRFPWVLFQAGGGVGPELISNTLAGASYHLLVTAAWVMLFLGRRCHPEPSWIDRAGRVIGVFWVLLAFWTWLVYVIEAWREGVP
ncbi:MAG: hypothetical protein U0835_24955 [Isosphaeraceae bacterium]